MSRLTQSVTVDRGSRALRLGALIAAALMLAFSAFSASAGAAELGSDNRARARRLRIACRMGGGGRRAAQGRLHPQMNSAGTEGDLARVRCSRRVRGDPRRRRQINARL